MNGTTPNVKNKTRLKIRDDKVLENFPLWPMQNHISPPITRSLYPCRKREDTYFAV